jgi:hypothetical protein
MLKAETTSRTIPKLPPKTEFQLIYNFNDEWWCCLTPRLRGPVAEGRGSSPRAAVNRCLKQFKHYEKEGLYVAA